VYVLQVIIICTPNRQLIPFILIDTDLPTGRSVSINIKTIAIFSLFCTIVIVLIHLIIMFYQMSECILYLQIEIYKVSGWISNVDEYIIFIS